MTIDRKKDKLIIFDTTLRDGEQVTITKHSQLRIFISFNKQTQLLRISEQKATTTY